MNYAHSGDDQSLSNLLDQNRYVQPEVTRDIKTKERISKYIQQLTEGLRIAREFPMEYQKIDSHKRQIAEYLQKVSSSMRMKNSRVHLGKYLDLLKKLSLTYMDKQTLERMT
jgi:hypothetical protein